MMFVLNILNGLVVLYYVILFEEDVDGILIVSYFGCLDEQLYEFGEYEMFVIVQGVYGYILLGWYVEGDFILIWNYVMVYFYGMFEIFEVDENFVILQWFVDYFEMWMLYLVFLDYDEEYVWCVVCGIVGLWICVDCVDVWFKFSQNKLFEVCEMIILVLCGDGVYLYFGFVDEMDCI